MRKKTKRQLNVATILAAIFALSMAGLSTAVQADHSGGLVTIMHYFTGDLGRDGINKIFKKFQESKHITVFDNPVGHENFKADVREMAKQGYLPDVFSYWAGVRTQSIADGNHLHDLTPMWGREGLAKITAPAVVEGAAFYNGKQYLAPFGYHMVGFFYNPKVLEKAGVKALPKDWPSFMTMVAALKAQGITPFALGSKFRWPAQFWFDYLLIRSAGTDFRRDLMAGKESFEDPRVVWAMEQWATLMTHGFFNAEPNKEDWTDAADRVASGEAAMTLMGTWITGYWKGKGLVPGKDYDLFEFPEIEPNLPMAVVGPVDGLVISAKSRNLSQAEKLVAFMVGNKVAQATWAQSQGALSPHLNVDERIYSDIMKKALVAVQKADRFMFNFDLAAAPEVAEAGLVMFAKFLSGQVEIATALKKVEAASKKQNRSR